MTDKDWHILNLGAGVQSTVLYLMALDGELDGVTFDVAIFADTQEEPAGVYSHLDWLNQLGGPEILKVTAGKIGNDLLKGENSPGQRFASVPAFTRHPDGGPVGQVRRQCTSEYKIAPIEKAIRRQVLGLKPRKHVPKDVTITQYMGFSFDEPGRAARAKGRFQLRGWQVRFPLFELMMTRLDCQRYLEDRVPHAVPRSACVFCPYKSDREWRNLKENDAAGWARAVEVDDGLRRPGAIVNRNMVASLYIHRSTKPLADAYLAENQGELDFMNECEGGCGL
jgi:hypothetical protein